MTKNLFIIGHKKRAELKAIYLSSPFLKHPYRAMGGRSY